MADELFHPQRFAEQIVARMQVIYALADYSNPPEHFMNYESGLEFILYFLERGLRLC